MKPVSDSHDWIEAVANLKGAGEAYVLITVLGAIGSTPRDSGTKMVASSEGFYGSIGGGHLELKALEIAGAMLATGRDDQRIEHISLGASLGQCCGGRHTLLFESFAGARLNVALFGAGHVGTALARVLQTLPCRLYWVDSREDQHSTKLTANVIPITSDDPKLEVNAMPPGSYYLIMTHSHQQDFEILDAVLRKGDAGYIGLIGSQTKWRRFRLRLEHKDYAPEVIDQVHCPVGLTQVPGKLPSEIAVSIAGQVIAAYHALDPLRLKKRGIKLSDVEHLIT